MIFIFTVNRLSFVYKKNTEKITKSMSSDLCLSQADVDKTTASNKRRRVVGSYIPKDSAINGTWI